MKEMLSNALNGNRSGGLFSVATEPNPAYTNSAMNGTFAMPSAVTPSSAQAGYDMMAEQRRAVNMQQGAKAASRKPSVTLDVS